MAWLKKYASVKEYVLNLGAEIFEEKAAIAAHVEEISEGSAVAKVEEYIPEEFAQPIRIEEEAEVSRPVEEQPQAEESEEAVAEVPAEQITDEAEPYSEEFYEPIEEIMEAFPEAPKKPRAPAKAFDFKIVTADEITQDRYNELKNFAMQYKKVKSRVSKKFDSLNSGRIQFVKFGLAGRTLKVYLNLNLGDTDPKYHCKDQSFKKPYVQVPTLIRVRSGRAVKYAKRLIEQCAAACGFKQNNKYVPQDYIILMEELYKANLEKGEAAISDEE